MTRWRMRIPEVDFVCDVDTVQVKEDRDRGRGRGVYTKGRSTYTIEIKLLVHDPRDAPSFLNKMQQCTLLLKQVEDDGSTGTKIRGDNMFIREWDLSYSHSPAGVIYALNFEGNEMKVIE